MKVSEGEPQLDPTINKAQAEMFNEYFRTLNKYEQDKYINLFKARKSERFEDYFIQFLWETDTTEIRKILSS
tara:strand:+ start:204 stop:419 length:216 start_codon:yes stop_codon:yes gene_type:complete